MLRKLIKHEFRATARIMWPIFGGMLALTILMRFGAMLILERNDNFFLNGISILTVMLFFAGLFALAFAPLVVSGSRFKSSVLGNEGYLTMTLPVSTNQMLVSKLITNAVWYAATAIVFALILAVLSAEFVNMGDIGEIIGNLIRGLRHLKGAEIGHIALILFELLLDAVASVTLGTVLVYAAYAIGFSANRHKSLWTVLLIYVFFHIVSNAWIAVLFFFGEKADYWVDFMSGAQGVETILAAALLATLALAAVFYAVTHYFLTHKLNLE